MNKRIKMIIIERVRGRYKFERWFNIKNREEMLGRLSEHVASGSGREINNFRNYAKFLAISLEIFY